jgi:hypothetical protein
MKRIQVGPLKGKVGIRAVDGAQLVKDKTTAYWKAFSELEADYVSMLGPTPMANVDVVS